MHTLGFPRLVWAFGVFFAFLFLITFIVLTAFAAPEHDDFCFAYMTRDIGFVATLAAFYSSLTGRIVPMALIELPSALSNATGIAFSTAYSGLLAVFAALFFLASAIIAIRSNIWGRWIPRALVAIMLPASFVAAAPSPHDMLYWMPGVACYVPAGVISILLLAESVRAIRRDENLSHSKVAALCAVVFIGALCNEVTGPWLVAIAVNSLAVRYMIGQRLLFKRHIPILASATAGFVIVASAPGNATRIASSGGLRSIGSSLFQALRYSSDQFGHFLSNPAVLACIAVAVIVSLGMKRRLEPRSEKILGVSILVTCLACSYFAYFAHEFSTGERLVGRAQNQTLILLLFGSMASASILARAMSDVIAPWSWLPTSAAVMIIVCVGLWFSPNATLLRKERRDIYKFYAETIERDTILRSPSDPAIVAEHASKPRLLLRADIAANIECIAAFYRKSSIEVIKPE
jgi:hypothetical protein